MRPSNMMTIPPPPCPRGTPSAMAPLASSSWPCPLSRSASCLSSCTCLRLHWPCLRSNLWRFVRRWALFSAWDGCITTTKKSSPRPCWIENCWRQEPASAPVGCWAIGFCCLNCHWATQRSLSLPPQCLRYSWHESF